MKNKEKIFAVAPMMDRTDRYCRAFHRQLTQHALLYTEMVTANAVIHGNRERLIGLDPLEHPVALQLGGSDPAALAEASRIGEAFGYDEINLNVGCPSDRVKAGYFGAALMADPALVARCTESMKSAVSIPITIKCRIGIDDQTGEASLDDFTRHIVASGADRLWVHARKAWLKGLSPKENRDIPPLNYDRVHRLKETFPALFIGINGGIESLASASFHLSDLDGIMLGRAAYQKPAVLCSVDEEIYGIKNNPRSLHQYVHDFLPVVENMLNSGARLHSITRHMLGLFSGRPSARRWRQILSQNAVIPGAGAEVIEEALADVTDIPVCFKKETGFLSADAR